MTRSPEHDWQPPPAGQGTLAVCAKCGARRRPPATAEPCDYARALHPAPARATEYDPHEER